MVNRTKNRFLHALNRTDLGHNVRDMQHWAIILGKVEQLSSVYFNCFQRGKCPYHRSALRRATRKPMYQPYVVAPVDVRLSYLENRPLLKICSNWKPEGDPGRVGFEVQASGIESVIQWNWRDHVVMSESDSRTQVRLPARREQLKLQVILYLCQLVAHFIGNISQSSPHRRNPEVFAIRSGVDPPARFWILKTNSRKMCNLDSAVSRIVPLMRQCSQIWLYRLLINPIRFWYAELATVLSLSINPYHLLLPLICTAQFKHLIRRKQSVYAMQFGMPTPISMSLMMI